MSLHLLRGNSLHCQHWTPSHRQVESKKNLASDVLSCRTVSSLSIYRVSCNTEAIAKTRSVPFVSPSSHLHSPKTHECQSVCVSITLTLPAVDYLCGALFQDTSVSMEGKTNVKLRVSVLITADVWDREVLRTTVALVVAFTNETSCLHITYSKYPRTTPNESSKPFSKKFTIWIYRPGPHESRELCLAQHQVQLSSKNSPNPNFSKLLNFSLVTLLFAETTAARRLLSSAQSKENSSFSIKSSPTPFRVIPKHLLE